MTSAPRLLTSALLDELQALLLERGARVAQRWRPQRRAAEEVIERVRALGLSLPAELAVWWSWHDGAEGEKFMDRAIGLGWEPLSLDEAIGATEALRRTFTELEQPDRWSSEWIVFGFDGSHGHLVSETAATQGQPAPVHCFFVDDWPDQLPTLPSLGELVSFWIEALRDGTLRVDDQGHFEYLGPDEMARARGDLGEFL